MTPDLIELGRRAVACKRWRWMSGMLGLRDAPGYRDHRQPEVRVRGSAEADLARDWAAVPDLEDPATLGCLIEIVRTAWAGRVVVSIGNGWFSVEADSEEVGFYADQDSEINLAAALVAALETAP